MRPIHPGVSIGHVHLKVADLRRALDFYCGVLGFEVTQLYGDQAAFLSAGGYTPRAEYLVQQWRLTTIGAIDRAVSRRHPLPDAG